MDIFLLSLETPTISLPPCLAAFANPPTMMSHLEQLQQQRATKAAELMQQLHKAQAALDNHEEETLAMLTPHGIERDYERRREERRRRIANRSRHRAYRQEKQKARQYREIYQMPVNASTICVMDKPKHLLSPRDHAWHCDHTPEGAREAAMHAAHAAVARGEKPRQIKEAATAASLECGSNPDAANRHGTVACIEAIEHQGRIRLSHHVAQIKVGVRLQCFVRRRRAEKAANQKRIDRGLVKHRAAIPTLHSELMRHNRVIESYRQVSRASERSQPIPLIV